MVVGRGTKHSTLYKTHAKIVKDVVHAVEFVDETDLWHNRLCHMSEKGMFALAKKNVLVLKKNICINVLIILLVSKIECLSRVVLICSVIDFVRLVVSMF